MVNKEHLFACLENKLHCKRKEQFNLPSRMLNKVHETIEISKDTVCLLKLI